MFKAILFSLLLILCISPIGFYWGWVDDIFHNSLIAGYVTVHPLFDYSYAMPFISRILAKLYVNYPSVAWYGFFQIGILFLCLIVYIYHFLKCKTTLKLWLIIFLILLFSENLIALTFNNTSIIVGFTGVFILLISKTQKAYIISFLFILISCLIRFELIFLIPFWSSLVLILKGKVFWKNQLVVLFFSLISFLIFNYYASENLGKLSNSFKESGLKMLAVSDYGYLNLTKIQPSDSLSVEALKSFSTADTSILSKNFLEKVAPNTLKDYFNIFSFQDRLNRVFKRAVFYKNDILQEYNYLFLFIFHFIFFALFIFLAQCMCIKLVIVHILSFGFLFAIAFFFKMEYRFYLPYITCYTIVLFTMISENEAVKFGKMKFIVALILFGSVYQLIRIINISNDMKIIMNEKFKFATQIDKIDKKYIFLDLVTTSMLPLSPTTTLNYNQNKPKILSYPDLLILPYNDDFSSYFLKKDNNLRLNQFAEFILQNKEHTIFIYSSGIRSKFYEKAFKRYGINITFEVLKTEYYFSVISGKYVEIEYLRVK